MKKILSLLMIIVFILSFGVMVFAETGTNSSADSSIIELPEFKVNAKSAILIEAETGTVLFKQDETNMSSPASVTKIMTLLLVCEAIEDGRINLSDDVSISSHAASMGGSQVFLEEGERMKLEELIKCTVIASANDAALALAEHTYGSEGMFVDMMNKRAAELGMKNTNFENVTGLDDTTTNHKTSALDIAIMSRQLIKYDIIRKYSSLWQDTIRGGEFTLTNTNRLVRFYDGCNGLKTGSTDKAGYCISATAERDGMQLIAVIMGSPTRDERNNAAKQLLDYGFSSFGIYKADKRVLENADIHGGVKTKTPLYTSDFSAVVPKGAMKRVDMVFDIPKYVKAPVKAGEPIGKVTYKIDDKILGEAPIYSAENVKPITVGALFIKILKTIFSC